MHLELAATTSRRSQPMTSKVDFLPPHRGRDRGGGHAVDEPWQGTAPRRSSKSATASYKTAHSIWTDSRPRLESPKKIPQGLRPTPTRLPAGNEGAGGPARERNLVNIYRRPGRHSRRKAVLELSMRERAVRGPVQDGACRIWRVGKNSPHLVRDCRGLWPARPRSTANPRAVRAPPAKSPLPILGAESYEIVGCSELRRPHPSREPGPARGAKPAPRRTPACRLPVLVLVGSCGGRTSVRWKG